MGFAGGTGATSINSATDVALSTVSDAQQLQWNTGIAKWQNGAASTKLIESVNTVASSGATETLPDTNVASIHNVTLTANCAITFPTATAGKSFTLCITHGSSGFDITWPVSVIWPNGVEPTLTSTVAKRDVFSFACMVNGEWMGFVSGLNF